MEGFNALMYEVLLERDIEGERPADFVDRIVTVDTDFAVEVFPVEVGCAKEVVMGEDNGVRPLKRGVEG